MNKIIVLGIAFLLCLIVPSLPASAATSQAPVKVTYTTNVAFNYTITIYPGSSGLWTMTVTNTGTQGFDESVGIRNATSLGYYDLSEMSPGQSVQSSFDCQVYNYTSDAWQYCTFSSGAVYQVYYYMDGTNSIGGSVNVTANGIAVYGSSMPGMNVTWRTSAIGGKTANWGLKVNNIGTQGVTFYATLSYECRPPHEAPRTCTETSTSVQLAKGDTYSFSLRFTPKYNSIPAGKQDLTVELFATFSNGWTLYLHSSDFTATK